MNNWQGIKNGMNLSQKFLDKIKPEYALKNKINGAEKQMESQILRLDQAHDKLKRNHARIRISITARLTDEQIEKSLSVLENAKNKFTINN